MPEIVSARSENQTGVETTLLSAFCLNSWGAMLVESPLAYSDLAHLNLLI